jgi:phosphoribosylformylglycinamidine cyclo-ligase
MTNRPTDDDETSGDTYAEAGVDTQGADDSLRALQGLIEATFTFSFARPLLPLGHFANVLELSPEMGLAISTDGVGTKILVAQALGKYDTVGIDCVAMNANDVLCVGARPVAMVDYVAVERAEPAFLAEIVKGICEGARQARISVPGGEIAQVREMLHPTADGHGFDLVGTCVGTVHPQRVLTGKDVRPGDLVLGLASSGIHSNGLTLARRVLFDRAGMRPTDHVAELGRAVGEELLTPTRIYVPAVLQMLDEGLAVRALAHLTGDGFLNLARVDAPVGFVVENLLQPQPIFSLIQHLGKIDETEMFLTYNMGTGFCVVVDPEHASRAQAIARANGETATVIGYAVGDPQRRIWIAEKGLCGIGKRFAPCTNKIPPNPGRNATF